MEQHERDPQDEIRELRETNTRLNRRCQKAEAELAEYKRTLRSKVRTVRAWQKKARAEYNQWRGRNCRDWRLVRDIKCGACATKWYTAVDVYSYYPFQQWVGNLGWRLTRFFRDVLRPFLRPKS